MKIEMHAHTSEGSPCAQIPAREAVRAYSQTDYDGIVITNHNELLQEWLRGYPDLKLVSGSDFHVMENLAAGGIVIEENVETSKELAEYLRQNKPQHLISAD